jgi:hypothetical protein
MWGKYVTGSAVYLQYMEEDRDFNERKARKKEIEG